MDLNKMLAELRNERDQLAEAILTLQRLAAPCSRTGQTQRSPTSLDDSAEATRQAAGEQEQTERRLTPRSRDLKSLDDRYRHPSR
jgi:hypothetical protein